MGQRGNGLTTKGVADIVRKYAYQAMIENASIMYDSAGKITGANPNIPVETALVFIQIIYVTMVYGPIAAFLVEFFPAKIRYTSLSIPYHLGNGEFGGWPAPSSAPRLRVAQPRCLLFAARPCGTPDDHNLIVPLAAAPEGHLTNLVRLAAAASCRAERIESEAARPDASAAEAVVRPGRRCRECPSCRRSQSRAPSPPS
jgi:hypothetical protein